MLAFALALANPQNPKEAGNAAAYGIPRTPASDVNFITNEQLCTRAARRFNQESGRDGKPERPVYIIHFKLLASFTH